MNRTTYCFCHGRWKGVADLPVCGGLLADEHPLVREPLEPRRHAYRELRFLIVGEVRSGCLVRDPVAIDAQVRPRSFCTGRSKVGPTMQLGPANDGWSNASRTLCPRVGATPAACAHQVPEHIAHGNSLRAAGRPYVPLGGCAPQRDQDESRTKLRHAEVRCIQHAPINVTVTKIREFLAHPFPIVLKLRLRESGYVFKQNCFRSDRRNEVERGRKEVSCVVRAKLKTRHTERGTWHPASEQINRCVFAPGELPNILQTRIPVGPICAKSFKCCDVVFDRHYMMKSRSLQTQSLAAGSGADLY